MSERIERIGADLHEPAVHSAALAKFVGAARAQTTPRLRIDAATVTAAWKERRSQRRRTLGIAVAAGLGALAIAGLYGQRGPNAAPTRADVVAHAPVTPTPSPTESPALETERPQVQAPVAAPQLAPMVTIAAVGDVAPVYDVRGAFDVELRSGAARFEVEAGAEQPLAVQLPDGALEIFVGVTRVEVAGSVSRVEVVEGSVFRIALDGTRTELLPKSISAAAVAPELRGDVGDVGASAQELAELAESRLAAGDRAGAITHLTRLVRRYPRSGAARTGLIDLGRLLRADGQRDAARCAYAEFLKRYPRSALEAEVERALDKLGEGECRGLTPR
jgi:hypothetical protein